MTRISIKAIDSLIVFPDNTIIRTLFNSPIMPNQSEIFSLTPVRTNGCDFIFSPCACASSENQETKIFSGFLISR